MASTSPPSFSFTATTTTSPIPMPTTGIKTTIPGSPLPPPPPMPPAPTGVPTTLSCVSTGIHTAIAAATWARSSPAVLFPSTVSPITTGPTNLDFANRHVYPLAPLAPWTPWSSTPGLMQSLDSRDGSALLF